MPKFGQPSNEPILVRIGLICGLGAVGGLLLYAYGESTSNKPLMNIGAALMTPIRVVGIGLIALTVVLLPVVMYYRHRRQNKDESDTDGV